MTRPLRLLQMHFGKDGGAERFFVNLARSLGNRGVDQRFVIRPDRIWRKEIADLGPIIENHYRYLSISGWWLQFHVARMCRDWKPDAIIAWQPRAGRLVPNQPDAVKLTRLGDFPTHLGNMRSSDAMVVNVPAIGDTCRELGWTKPVLMISNFARSVTPVPVDRATLDTPRDAFLIAGGGRFVPRKGLDLLIRAAARVPGAWLWLIGDGKERARLEALVQSEGIAERTRFAGWVEEPIHYFAAADVVGLPSRHEPLGNIALEAWRAGVPLVATRSEGPSWFVEDGVSGLMVDIDDLDGFAAALARLRDEPALAGALVRGGRAQLEALFSERAITDAYLRVFRGDFSAVQQRPGRGE